MTEIEDRRIHAECGAEKIVRYGRDKTWFIEYDPDRMRPRRQVTITQAVERAVELWHEGGEIHFGLPGGRTFDRKLRTRYRLFEGSLADSHGSGP